MKRIAGRMSGEPSEGKGYSLRLPGGSWNGRPAACASFCVGIAGAAAYTLGPMQDLVDNRYAIKEVLGSGGMAKVYLAHDEVLGRDVALKVLAEQYADDEEFVERFRREARSAAALSHPNIVSVYDRGETGSGTAYISMEYVARGTLKEKIREEGRMASSVAVGVAVQIAEALEAAHERGVIHRDIKPQNVLVTRSGDIKVADFGIARAASASAMTGSTVLGTASYMSPEQAAGARVGPRTDLYSLGVVLFEMLTGKLPHESGAASEGGPPRPGSVVPGIADALDDLVSRLLSRDPVDRPSSASDLLDELRPLGDGDPGTRRPAPTKDTVAAPVPTKTRERGTRTGPRTRRGAGLDLRSAVPWIMVALFVLIVALVIRYVLTLLGNPPIP